MMILRFLLVGLVVAVLVLCVMVRSYRKAVRAIMEQATKASQAAEELAEIATMQKRRADELFGVIEGIEKERDQWLGFYRSSSQAAGAAQAWLIRDLTRIVAQANSYGARLREAGQKAHPVDVDPLLRETVEEFAALHVQKAGTEPIAKSEAAVGT